MQKPPPYGGGFAFPSLTSFMISEITEKASLFLIEKTGGCFVQGESYSSLLRAVWDSVSCTKAGEMYRGLLH